MSSYKIVSLLGDRHLITHCETILFPILVPATAPTRIMWGWYLKQPSVSGIVTVSRLLGAHGRWRQIIKSYTPAYGLVPC